MRSDDLIVLAIMLALFAGWVGGLVDVNRRDPEAFAATGRSRAQWLVAVALTGIVATFVYVCFVRRSVRRAEDTMVRPHATRVG